MLHHVSQLHLGDELGIGGRFQHPFGRSSLEIPLGSNGYGRMCPKKLLGCICYTDRDSGLRDSQQGGVFILASPCLASLLPSCPCVPSLSLPSNLFGISLFYTFKFKILVSLSIAAVISTTHLKA